MTNKLFYILCFILFSNSIIAQNKESEYPLYPYRVGDKWGYSNKDGQIKIPAKYDYVSKGFKKNYVNPKSFVKFKGVYFFIDKKGSRINDNVYSNIKKNSLGFEVIEKSDKKVCLNYWLKPITCGGYICTGSEGAPNFHGYKENNKYGVRYQYGVIGFTYRKTPAVWDSYRQSKGRYIIVGSNARKGVIRMDARILIPLHYEEIRFVNSKSINLLIAKYNGKFGLINNKNQVKIPFQYDNISMDDGLIKVEIGDVYYYYSPNLTKLYKVK